MGLGPTWIPVNFKGDLDYSLDKKLAFPLLLMTCLGGNLHFPNIPLCFEMKLIVVDKSSLTIAIFLGQILFELSTAKLRHFWSNMFMLNIAMLKISFCQLCLLQNYCN